MNNLQRLNLEYKKDLNKYIDEHKKSSIMQQEYILSSTAKYHGRCVRTCYLPKLFTKMEEDFLKKIVKQIYAIFDKVIDNYFKDEEYRKLFEFDEKLEQLILRKPLYTSNIPIARVDIFFNEENYDFKFCEFNTDGTSAMNEDRELNNAIKYTKAYEMFNENHTLKTYELFDTWIHEFLNIYETYEKKVSNPYVAIVDFMDSATTNEFEIFAERFRKNGIQTSICEIKDLRYDGKHLYTKSNQKIDVIYRRAVTSDILNHFDEVDDFINAVRDENVCLMGDFRTQIVHNKILFKILHLEQTKCFLSKDEVDFIEKHVPYTVSMSDGEFNMQDVLKNKDKWILKPEDSYGSKGVYAGVEYNHENWKKIIEKINLKEYILQEFYRPYTTQNVDFTDSVIFRDYYNLTGIYVYNGKYAGLYSRVSKTEIISTQYSEISLPTIIVDANLKNN